MTSSHFKGGHFLSWFVWHSKRKAKMGFKLAKKSWQGKSLKSLSNNITPVTNSVSFWQFKANFLNGQFFVLHLMFSWLLYLESKVFECWCCYFCKLCFCCCNFVLLLLLVLSQFMLLLILLLLLLIALSQFLFLLLLLLFMLSASLLLLLLFLF